MLTCKPRKALYKKEDTVFTILTSEENVLEVSSDISVQSKLLSSVSLQRVFHLTVWRESKARYFKLRIRDSLKYC